MLKTILNALPGQRTRDVATTAAGMVMLLTGRKLFSVGLFLKGAYGLELQWREKHPEVSGGLSGRWDAAVKFYADTHQNPTNRKLHMVGIPLIVGGSAGLLAFRPFRPAWMLSASAYSWGWMLNFVGHGFVEKKAPAFADDPLSFMAGPLWDLQQWRSGAAPAGGSPRDGAPEVTVNVAPQGDVV